MRKYNNALLVWLPTGHKEGGILRTTWKILSSPVFLIGVAVINVAVMVYFNLTVWWVGAIAPSTIGLAIMAILLRRSAQGKLLISNRQAEKCNRCQYATQWLPNRYLNRICIVAERTRDDDSASSLLFRHLGEALITIGLYEETGRKKIKMLTGHESIEIKLIEFYADILTSGIGYILLEPSVSLIAKIESVDERIISRVLRDSGFGNYTVERVSYDDDLALFILKDETVSCAYDFSGVE